MRRVRIGIIVGLGIALLWAGAPAAANEPDSVGLHNPDQGQWQMRGSPQPFFFGDPDDTPFMGDWNYNGEDTPGLFRRTDGFVYLRNSNVPGVADISYFFGDPDDVPLVGDFDGDGGDTVSLYRPSEQRVYITNHLGPDGGSLGPADFSYTLGDPGDVPFVGDFDGDGVDTIGLHRPATGEVFLSNRHTGGAADIRMVYGDPADKFVAGDWDGDGVDTPGVYRPSERTFYQRNTNSAGPADNAIPLGDGSGVPFAGKWGPPYGFDVGDAALVSRYHVERDTSEGVELYYKDMTYWPRSFATGLDLDPDDEDQDTVDSAGRYVGWDALSPSTRWEFRNYGPRANWMHFTLTRPARVAVVWRDDLPLPSWMSGWTPGGTVIIDGDLAPVYETTLAAGPVALGSVEKSANARQMYLVLLAEADGEPSPTPPVPTGYAPVPPNQPCPDWVHARHKTTGPDGATYNTWHPQIDPVYWCYFGHEHGSNPALIPGAPKVPYQYVAAHVPQHEPDAGFKEFIFRDMTGGHWVRFVIHAGTASDRRVCARFHTLYVMVYDTNGAELYHAGFKADYGAAFATSHAGGGVLAPTGCGYDMAALAEELGSRRNRRLNVGAESNNYETWDSRQETAAVIGLGMVQFEHGFDIRNPMSHCVDRRCDAVVVREPHKHNATRRTLQMAGGSGDFTFDADHALGQGAYHTDPFVTALRQAGDADAVRQYAAPGLHLSFARDGANRIECVAADPWLFGYTCHRIGGSASLDHVPSPPDMNLERSLTAN